MDHPGVAGSGTHICRVAVTLLDAVKDNARVKLTFHFWSGATTTYHITKSGSTVTGTTS
ncbi:hypothetical protein [Streptomyces sp. PSKA30]|uniref:hypothetical protein n=1 Tax=Streptomyces sp. PSKA30 TaxID=2874597 RepID=UPI001CD053A3|nr:hypothetical protein [Streptomyces sp. PSKA30]MBZ9645432.1 hypothetical protein [Streptomyces sp. PSKA30]